MHWTRSFGVAAAILRKQSLLDVTTGHVHHQPDRVRSSIGLDVRGVVLRRAVDITHGVKLFFAGHLREPDGAAVGVLLQR